MDVASFTAGWGKVWIAIHCVKNNLLNYYGNASAAPSGAIPSSYEVILLFWCREFDHFHFLAIAGDN